MWTQDPDGDFYFGNRSNGGLVVKEESGWLFLVVKGDKSTRKGGFDTDKDAIQAAEIEFRRLGGKLA